MKKLLLIVDAQYDFIEGGSLPVNGATEKMNGLVEHIANEKYDAIVFTADWHPTNHMSFVANGGMWPQHCVQHTHGAAIYQPLFDIANEKCGNVIVLEKGNISTKEEYSLMDNYFSSKEFLRFASNMKVDEVNVCGIAGDICVANTIKGLIGYGFKDNICVLKDFCPSIDDGTVLNTLIAENALKSV